MTGHAQAEFQDYEPRMASQVVALWNRTIGDIYPMSERLIRQVIEGNPSHRPSDGVTAWDNGQVIGFALIHRYRLDEPCCRELGGLAWLSAVIVAPEHQRRELGTLLVRHLRGAMPDLPDDRFRPGGGIHHFFPGPPDDLPAARPFLASLGFLAGERRVCDVRVELATYQLPPETRELVERQGLTAAPARERDWEPLLDLLANEFSANWRYRAGRFRAQGGDPADWIVLRRGDDVVGFSQCHHPGSAEIGPARYWSELRGPRPGGLGPIGVTPRLRGLGLGLALLELTLDRLVMLGATDAVADWTTLLDFYAKVGMQPWKCYTVA
jgi:GNAT superfamily N-acetyltransferase